MKDIKFARAGAPLERVPQVPGNPSILGKAKQNTEVLRKLSLNISDSLKIQNSGTCQLKFLMEPLLTQLQYKQVFKKGSIKRLQQS